VFEHIVYEVEAPVATITLNRPAHLNAWTARMGQEVREAVQLATADADVVGIVLTGAGRGFCAGADVSALAGHVPDGDVQAALPTEKEQDQPMPPTPMPPGGPGARPKAKAPEIPKTSEAAKRFKEKKGYANYYFSKQLLACVSTYKLSCGKWQLYYHQCQIWCRGCYWWSTKCDR